MKAKPEYVEGPEAWTRFRSALKAVVSAPKHTRPAKTKKPTARKG
jgi:hypothetical protein